VKKEYEFKLLPHQKVAMRMILEKDLHLDCVPLGQLAGRLIRIFGCPEPMGKSMMILNYRNLRKPNGNQGT
jgi:hypothetical protein